MTSNIHKILLFFIYLDVQQVVYAVEYSHCYIFGSQHVRTFDGETLDYRSPCSFQASYTCPPSVQVNAQFDVTIHNEEINGALSVNCVDVIYSSYIIKLCKDQTAYVDSTRVSQLITGNEEIRVYTGTMGKELAIHINGSDETVQVTMMSSGSVRVSLPDSYKGKVCGLCGNYDGTAENDLRLKDGTDVAVLSPEERAAQIATSYLEADESKIGCQTGSSVVSFFSSDCSSVDNVLVDLYSPEYCGGYDISMAQAFSTCVNVDPNMASIYKDICRYEFCENYLAGENTELGSACYSEGSCQYNSTISKAAVDIVAEIYVDECRSKNHQMPSWRTDYGTELSCNHKNTEYRFDGDKCPILCGLDASGRCSETNEDGCSCIDGYYRNGDSCVPVSECGCVDPNGGSYYEKDESWLDSLCSTNFTCQGANTVTYVQTACSVFASCSVNLHGRYMCSCNEGYTGDGFTCDKYCEAGSQPTSNGLACELCPIGYYNPGAGNKACLSCGEGNVTQSSGSTTINDCQAIVMLPDSTVALNGECYDEVYDQVYRRDVPSNVLPDGIPFGLYTHRSLYISTNGLISFGEAFVGRDPVSLNNSFTEGSFNKTVIAPYWFRQDLRRTDPSNQPQTKLCVDTYSLIEQDDTAAQESKLQLERIKVMLKSSLKYDTESFSPVYAMVTTWHKSIAYPFTWYDAADYKEYATYQSILVSDGMKTYVLFIYPSGTESTLLRRLNHFRHIYMGFNAQDGQTFFSYYLSTTADIIGLHAEESNTELTGRWIFEISNLGVDNTAATTCLTWYNEQQTIFTSTNPDLSEPCPCDRTTARADERYYFDDIINCASSLMPNEYSFYQLCCYEEFNGTLKTDPEQSGYPVQYQPALNPSGYDLFDKFYKDECCADSDYCSLYREYRPATTCSGYQPPSLCSGFGDPHLITSDGFVYTYNPIGEFWMIKTTDSRFSMQARMVQALNADGALIAATQFQAFSMQSYSNGVKSSRIHLEINNNRTDFVLYEDSNSLTAKIDANTETGLVVFSGGVIKKYNDSVTVTFNTESDKGVVFGLIGHYDDNQENDMTNSTGHVVCTPSDCDMANIHNLFGESWRITQSESLFWYRRGWDTNTYTDVTFRPSFMSASDLGDYDIQVREACNNEWTCIFDSVATNSTEVGSYTSLVQYEVMDKRNVLKNSHPTVDGKREIHAQINVSTTVTYAYSDADGDEVELVVVDQPETAVIEESAGIWTMTWTPTDYSPVSLSMFAREVNVIDRIPATSAELHVLFYISPNCQNGGTSNYTILAADGAITSLFFKVPCECQYGWAGENCDVDINGCEDDPCYQAECVDIEAINTVDSQYQCSGDCPVGYERTSGRNSTIDECFDIDECIVNKPCSLDYCINTRGSFVCRCEDGFQKTENETCVDIDECQEHTDGCSDVCVNTEGSFYCECFSESTLQADNKTCIHDSSNASLCNDQWNCSYACETSGSVDFCKCPRTQILDSSDNSTCLPFNECESEATNGCDIDSGASCVDKPDGYMCTCKAGYVLSNNGLACEVCPHNTWGDNCANQCACGDRAKNCDNVEGCVKCNVGWEGEQCLNNTDECSSVVSPCPDNSKCKDSPGSYTCICNTGYNMRVIGGVRKCININECAQTTSPCSKNAVCTDTEGSYTCTCKSGFTGDGVTCSNINECIDSPCVELAKCEDTEGSYGCTCLSGYHGDGRTSGTGCRDTNECIDAINACAANSICTNEVGTYSCECKGNYTGDGFNSCTDINECAEQPDICGTIQHGTITCTNLKPWYKCDNPVCNAGFILTSLSAGSYECLDINECLAPEACLGSHVTCQNTEGSYQCICNNFYKRVNRYCVDIDECVEDNSCSSRQICTNMDPGYDCSCLYGYSGENCDIQSSDVTFVKAEQSFDIPYNPDLNATDSDFYRYFNKEYLVTMNNLYNITGDYLGVNILNIMSGPGGDDFITVEYEVVYRGKKPTDLEHQTYYKLINQDYELPFNSSIVNDIKQLKFDGKVYECDDVICLNNFTCSLVNVDGYPLCQCSDLYTGYNCGVKIKESSDLLDNLLPLWISVGVASALLVMGCCACCAVIGITYRRRRRRENDQKIHRMGPVVARLVGRPHGPTLFNPATRLPAEAYNYQFPVGSIRSGSSTTSSTSSSSSSSRRSYNRTSANSRVGSTVPFATKWPRAYYSQASAKSLSDD